MSLSPLLLILSLFYLCLHECQRRALAIQRGMADYNPITILIRVMVRVSLAHFRLLNLAHFLPFEPGSISTF